MSENFFESEVVIEAIEDIVSMQDEILVFSEFADYATLEQQRENLDTLRKLSAKQKNMCFRCMLSDDPDAKILLAQVLSHFEGFGHTIDEEDPLKVFTEVEANLQEIDDDLTYAEKNGYFPGEEPGGEIPPYRI